MFAREANEHDALRESLDRFEILKVNAEDETGGGGELAERFQVEGYPTFVVLDGDGQLLRRWWGYDDAEDLIGRLAAIEADPVTIDAIRARFAASGSAPDAVMLAEYHASRREGSKAAGYYATAVEKGDPRQGYEVDLFDALRADASAGEADRRRLVEAAQAAFANPHIAAGERLSVAGGLLQALADGDVAPAVPLLDRALAETEGSDDPTIVAERSRRLVDRALHVDRDAELALTFRRQALADGWREDPSKLNEFAWWCFEHEVNLDEAERLARLGVELAEDDEQRAMILDTVAEIANLRGDVASAIEAMRQALEAAPDNAYYREQLQRFERDAG